MGRAELLAFKRDYYVPSRTKLVITGDLDPNDVRLECRDLFGNYKASGTSEDKMPLQTVPAETVVLNETTRGGGGQVALAFGANDMGSTMIEENVVAAAGVRNQCDVDEMVRLIRAAGRTPVQRDTLYRVVRRY